MNKENIRLRPQVIDTLYNIEKQLKEAGLQEKDILLLLKSRIRIEGSSGRTKQMPLDHIKAVLDALKEFEKELLKNQEKEVEGEE
ncbi:MAG: hypothetical protein ACOC44_12420 [Promethearchaeia archaeon]